MNEEQKHPHRINVRLSNAEYEYLTHCTKNADGSSRKLSDMVRIILDNYMENNACPKRKQKNDISNLLIEGIIAEVRKIGNNVNQLARVANGIAAKKEMLSAQSDTKFSKSIIVAIEHLEDITCRMEELKNGEK